MTARGLPRLLLGAALSAGCVAGHAAWGAAPDLAAVLARHAEARGGRDAWKEIRSLEIRGTQLTFSVPSPFLLQRERPNRYRMEQTQLKRPVVEVFDGARAWWVNGLMGTEWPLPAPEPAAGVIAREAEFDTPLLGYPDNGHTLQISGPEEFEGSQAWKIEVERKGGGKETWYLDPGTGLEMARVSSTADFGQMVEKRTWFSDFRRVGTVVIPHRIESEYGTRNETFEVQSVNLNPALEASRFVQPPPEGMEALAEMAGEWDVTVETRAHPRAPWQPHQATALIQPRVEGGVLLESWKHNDQGQEIEILRLWSYDRFHKTYRVVQSDSVAFQQNVLQGTLSEGRLTVSNEATGTTWKTSDEEILTRLILHDRQSGTFRVDRETSRDAGKTWNTEEKLTYRKR